MLVHVVTSRWKRVDPWGWGAALGRPLPRDSVTRLPHARKRDHIHHSTHTESAQHHSGNTRVHVAYLAPNPRRCGSSRAIFPRGFPLLLVRTPLNGVLLLSLAASGSFLWRVGSCCVCSLPPLCSSSALLWTLARQARQARRIGVLLDGHPSLT